MINNLLTLIRIPPEIVIYASPNLCHSPTEVIISKRKVNFHDIIHIILIPRLEDYNN